MNKPTTLDQARLAIWNPDAYPAAYVRAAAVFVLGSLAARREDLDQATALV